MSDLMDTEAKSTTESTSDVLAAYQSELPTILSIINENYTPNETAKINAALATEPAKEQYTSAEQLFLTDLGNQMQAKNTAAANTLLQGSGADLVRTNAALQRELDPEYYSARTSTGNALTDLLSSYDLSGNLTGSEMAAVERAVNQGNVNTGNMSTPSAIRTTANAMEFGDKAYNRLNTERSGLSNAIGQAVGYMSGAKTSENPMSTVFNYNQTTKPTKFSDTSTTGSTVDSLANTSTSNTNTREASVNATAANATTTGEKAANLIPDY